MAALDNTYYMVSKLYYSTGINIVMGQFNPQPDHCSDFRFTKAIDVCVNTEWNESTLLQNFLYKITIAKGAVVYQDTITGLYKADKINIIDKVDMCDPTVIDILLRAGANFDDILSSYILTNDATCIMYIISKKPCLSKAFALAVQNPRCSLMLIQYMVNQGAYIPEGGKFLINELIRNNRYDILMYLVMVSPHGCMAADCPHSTHYCNVISPTFNMALEVMYASQFK